jgi:hypothetical protein
MLFISLEGGLVQHVSDDGDKATADKCLVVDFDADGVPDSELAKVPDGAEWVDKARTHIMPVSPACGSDRDWLEAHKAKEEREGRIWLG